MNKINVILDFDDTILDIYPYLKEACLKEYGIPLGNTPSGGYSLPRFENDWYDIHAELLKDFYRKYAKISSKNIKALQKFATDKRINLLVVTAERNAQFLEDKRDILASTLCSYGFNPSNVISCVDKSLIRADYIVDDYIKNLDKCSPYMKGILYNQKYNRKLEKYRNVEYTRVNNLLEAYEYISRDLERRGINDNTGNVESEKVC